MAWQPSTDPQGGLVSPNSFNEPSNPNDDPAAGRNNNYWAFKDRSGNQMLFNHERGYENMTFEHRTGSKLQLLPDGSVLLRAHRGKTEMVFGADRIKVTGTQDVVVEGGASLRVNGEYNVTVGGDYNLGVAGAFTVRSLNTNINTGCMDIACKNMTAISEGGVSITAGQAATFISEAGGMTIGSSLNSVAIGAGRQVGIVARAGDVQLESAFRVGLTGKTGIQIQSAGYITATTAGALTMSAEGVASLGAKGALNLVGGATAKLSSTGILSVDGTTALNLNSGVAAPHVPVPPDPTVTTDFLIQTPPKPVPCGDPATLAAGFTGVLASGGGTSGPSNVRAAT